ncbi:MAG: hypothetical protein AAF514_14140 [Verrucomicrobiota bacterium]
MESNLIWLVTGGGNWRRFLFAFLSLLIVRSGEAHKMVDSNLQLFIELGEEELIYELTVGTFILPALREVTFESPDRPGREAKKEAVEGFFKAFCPVKIDGIEVDPVLSHLEYKDLPDGRHLGVDVAMVEAFLTLSYPLKKKPKTVDMTWGLFLAEPEGGWEAHARDETHDPREIDLMFYVDGVLDFAAFSPSEPQYVWHAPPPVQLPGDRLKAKENGSGLGTGEAHSFSLAWPIWGLLVGGLVFLRWRTGRWQRGPLVAGAVCAVAAGLFYRPLMAANPLSRSGLPAEAAKTIFTDLHANIYRAFDYTDESSIYDSLSRSVEPGPLLDRIYGEVYQSLILREEGGVVCKVQKVEMEECRTTVESSERFEARCHWRVYGMVKHWGHAHQRINEYRARYTLEKKDEGWRITDVTVEEQRRLGANELE